MSAMWPALVFGSALALALVLLYAFRARPWYWHVLSVAVAMAMGLAPMPNWNGPRLDLTVGFLFVFLMTWGLGALLPRHHKL